MYTSWSEVPYEDKLYWAEWAIDNNKQEQTEEEKLAWINEREARLARPRRSFEPAPMVSAKSEAARMRSRRYQIQKKLEPHYQIYELFTPEEAAQRTGIQVEIMRGYLQYESQVPSSRIAAGPGGTYKLMTGFETGVERGA